MGRPLYRRSPGSGVDLVRPHLGGPHPRLSKITIVGALIAIVAMAYLAEKNRMRVQNELVASHEAYRRSGECLQESNIKLQDEIRRRIQSEEALAQSEQRYRDLFEKSPVPRSEGDWSSVQKFLSELPPEAFDDLEHYFQRHPALSAECWSMIDFKAANQALMEHKRMLLNMQLHQARRLQALGTLAGGIAHQFSNALGIILGRLDLITMPPDSDWTTSMREPVERLLRLTEQLLAYARGGKYQPRPFSANDLVPRILVEKEQRPEPQVRITRHLDDDLLTSRGILPKSAWSLRRSWPMPLNPSAMTARSTSQRPTTMRIRIRPHRRRFDFEFRRLCLDMHRRQR